MLNFKIISKIIGQLLFIEGGFMLVCLIMALAYREEDVMSFVVSLFITLSTGAFLAYLGRGAENRLSRRDAYFVVTATWVIFSFFGMFPFVIGGYINGISDAYFETMSGFTTTGATIIDDVERLPHGILFWRSLTQWIGGLGIVFFTIAVLPSMVGGNVKIFAAEATGPIKTKMHPRLSTSAKWIWSIYLVLTLACILAYWAAGMDWFDSVNYSMSTTATGGFATHNASTGYFHSPSIDYVCILFQFLAGMNFTLLYMVVFKRKLKSLFSNSEFRLYVSIILFATMFIMALLFINCNYTIEKALRSALFQVVSFITTTGLFNDNAAQWPHITWVVLGCLMFIGSCAGSTSGGFKCLRGVIVLKVLRNEFRHSLHPNAVLPVKINETNVNHSKLTSLLSFFALYVVMCLISAMIMIMFGIDNTNSITIALSSMSNVGPTLGTEIGPVMSWSELPDAVKWICSLLMLMGRLEIMTVLVLFTPSYWKEV